MGEFSMVDIGRSLAAQCAVFEALLLMVSAAHKMLMRAHARDVVRKFAGVPASLAGAAAMAVAAGESAAALLLVVPGYRAAGAALAALLFAAYLTLILRAMRQGRRDVDCGCSFGPARHPLGAYHVARNVLLLGVAVAVAAASAVTGAVAVQGSQAVAACALVALYAALDQVMALQPLRSGEVS